MNPVLAADQSITSARLRITAYNASEAELPLWLGGALAPDWDVAQLQAALEDGNGLLISGATGEPVGLAVVFMDRPFPASATVAFLAIEPARRFRGLGSEASLAIERHLRSTKEIQRFYAPVPDGRGLAVYFWLRLGYRPLLQTQAPGPLLGLSRGPKAGIWLLRTLD